MIDTKHFIEELKFSLNQGDLIKLKALLQYIDYLDKRTLRQMFFEMNKFDDELVLPIMIQVYNSHPSIIEAVPNIIDLITTMLPEDLSDLKLLYTSREITRTQLISELVDFFKIK
jgi:hypothetical protein